MKIYVKSETRISTLLKRGRQTTKYPWTILAFADPDLDNMVDKLVSSSYDEIVKFVDNAASDGLHILINYGMNWCDYINPDRYRQCVREEGPETAFKYATQLYTGDKEFFDEPEWISANTELYL